MKKKLFEIADITQGSILTRIKDEYGKKMKTLTMQQLSYYVNSSDDKGEDNDILVNVDKIENLCISKINDVVIGLSSCNAMVVEKENENKIILSNFIRVKVKQNLVDQNFLCWTINQNKDVRLLLNSFVQGTTKVAIIKATDFKNLEIDLIPLSEQKKIGSIYQLMRKKYRIERRKSDLRNNVYNKMLMEEYKKLTEEKR